MQVRQLSELDDDAKVEGHRPPGRHRVVRKAIAMDAQALRIVTIFCSFCRKLASKASL